MQANQEVHVAHGVVRLGLLCILGVALPWANGAAQLICSILDHV